MRHFRSINKSARVPVTEVRRRIHFHDCSSQPGISPGQPEQERKRCDSINRAPRLRLEPAPRYLVLHRRYGKQSITFLFQVCLKFSRDRVFADRLANMIQFGIEEQQSGVPGAQPTQRVFGHWRHNRGLWRGSTGHRSRYGRGRHRRGRDLSQQMLANKCLTK